MTPWLRGTPTISAYMGMHEKTVLRLLRRGKLHGHQPGGVNSTWFVHRANADAYLSGVKQRTRLSVR